MKNKAVKGAGVLATLALCITIVSGFEGLKTKAYKDIVGIPTICFGETRGVRMGDTKSVQECRVMLGDRLIEFSLEIDKCIHVPVPPKSYASFLSLAYNVGEGAFCRSTLVKKLNTGDIRGACNELLKWDRAGGKKVRGLTIRRNTERKLCLEGVDGV